MRPRQLRAWREQRGWTQAEAALWYGVDERTWRRYEGGECPLPLPLVRRLEDAPSGLTARAADA